MKIKLNFKKRLNEWATSEKRWIDKNGNVAKPFKIDNNGTLIKYSGDAVNITIPSIVNKIGKYAFIDCTEARTVTVPSSVTEIEDHAFSSTYLTSVDIPGSVTIFGENIFNSSRCLEQVTLPNTLTEIPIGTFSQCSSLRKIVIPSTVHKINKGAFESCSNLKEIIIPKGVTEIGDNTFSYCQLQKISIPDSVTKIGSGAFYRNGMSWNTGRQSWVLDPIDIMLPKNLKIIEQNTFGESSLRKIFIPRSVTKIDKYSLASCELLKDIYYEGTKQEWDAIIKESLWIGSTDPDYIPDGIRMHYDYNY